MDEFERWLNEFVVRGEGGNVLFVRASALALTPEQVARLICRLASLAGLGGGGTLSGEALTEIRARAEAATPGPWTWEGFGPRQVESPDPSVNGFLANVTVQGPEGGKANASFIAHARVDVPALLAHAAALAAEVEGLNHVVACQREDSLAYQAGEREGRAAGAEEERGRVLALLKERAKRSVWNDVRVAIDAAIAAIEKGERP